MADPRHCRSLLVGFSDHPCLSCLWVIYAFCLYFLLFQQLRVREWSKNALICWCESKTSQLPICAGERENWAFYTMDIKCNWVIQLSSGFQSIFLLLPKFFRFSMSFTFLPSNTNVIRVYILTVGEVNENTINLTI